MEIDKSGVGANDVSDLVLKEHWLVPSGSFSPHGVDELSAFSESGISLPQKLEDLEETLTRSYDMSVSGALEAQIPVAGVASGGFSRKVIVLERAGFSKVEPQTENDTEKHYGYAVRLCVTVNRWEASAKVSLPFLAASAQLGTIEAQWMLQVIGLKGAAIEAAILPPTELNVDTFVIAKQSLEKLIAAIRAPGTTFHAQLIAEIRQPDLVMDELRRAMGRAYALTCLERGRSLTEAQERVGASQGAFQDAMTGVYAEVAGLTNMAAKPTKEARQKAAEICGNIRADVPRLW